VHEAIVLILDDPHPGASATVAGDASLDDLFRAAAARHPEAIALVDAPDRARFTDGTARRLTFAQADRVISAIAGRLRDLGLHPDAVVALQLANTVDGVLAFLGALRAELIVMPMPLLWRRADVISALRRTGASAMIVSGRISATSHFELAVHAAAEAFTVRHVCGFGSHSPDGAVALDDLYAFADSGAAPAASERARAGGRGSHLAAITWDMSAAGALAVARSDAQLIAGGLAVLLESSLPPQPVILSTVPPSLFGGIAMTLLPWLLAGGTLALHHPFDSAVFAEQTRALAPDAVIVPGPVASRLAAAGILASPDCVKAVIGAWRAPEQLQRAPDWRGSAMIDVRLFGEIGLIATRRQSAGTPTPLLAGAVHAPRGAQGALAVAEIAVTAGGTLALRGPMVPRCPFPPGVERTSLPRFAAQGDGFVDTGQACAVDAATQALVVSGPPSGLVSFGGYRFAVGELTRVINGLDPSGTLAVVPDALAGYRLAGTAANRQAIRLALHGIGANPLLVEAFGTRRRPATALA
jgi:hypothetical protein